MKNVKISKMVLEDVLTDVIDDVRLRHNEIVRRLRDDCYTAEERQGMVNEQKTLKNILLSNVKKLTGVQVVNLPDGRIAFDFDEKIW